MLNYEFLMFIEKTLMTTMYFYFHRLLVAVKIFIVMGLCWVCETISWFLNIGQETIYSTDIIIAIQGIIIFIIYICKPATYRLLREKFCGKKRSDGKWTTDFNISSKNHTERQTSTSGISMNSVHVDSKQNSTKSHKASSNSAWTKYKLHAFFSLVQVRALDLRISCWN